MSTLARTVGFAHRGAPTEDRPANSITALRRALELGSCGLESDIALTSDGVPALWHPRISLRRRLDISRVPRRDLPAEVPTLEDVYVECGIDFELALDMGQPRAVEAVIEVAQRFGAEQRLWLTYWKLPLLASWRKRWPWLHLVFPTIPVRPRGADALLERLSAAGVDALNLHHRFCTRRWVNRAHANGLLLFAWGIRSPRALDRSLRSGADGVFCDNVEEMIRAIRAAGTS